MTATKDDMSFLDHLEELRWHLIRSTIAIFIIAVLAFFFKDFIFDQIIFGQEEVIFLPIVCFANSRTFSILKVIFAHKSCLLPFKTEPWQGNFQPIFGRLFGQVSSLHFPTSSTNFGGLSVPDCMKTNVA